MEEYQIWMRTEFNLLFYTEWWCLIIRRRIQCVWTAFYRYQCEFWRNLGKVNFLWCSYGLIIPKLFGSKGKFKYQAWYWRSTDFIIIWLCFELFSSLKHLLHKCTSIINRRNTPWLWICFGYNYSKKKYRRWTNTK